MTDPSGIPDGGGDSGTSRRARARVRGAVQGVGFRPFVYRLALERKLAGWVRNDASGVVLEVEGAAAAIELFFAQLHDELPPHAAIHALEREEMEPLSESRFEIRHDGAAGARTAVVLPDLATCSDCLRETLSPGERRHLYPFTNCTNCGPRFTIIRDLPYDRPNTTMRGFPLCADCANEYADPLDRRFHAQPIACPVCGPQLAFGGADGVALETGDGVIAAAAAALLAGDIVALKGLGGYQLLCDATSEAAVRTLRERKARVEKPFALLCAGLAEARELCDLSEAAATALESRERPIVLMPRRAGAGLPDAVAPGLSRLGVMLPATALHHLLCAAVARPLVATSGNLSDEPIAIADDDARERLGAIAGRFLWHNRPIERHADDSVGTVMDGEFRLLRRARGYAPLPVRVRAEWPTVLAVGAHLKNTVALSLGGQVFVSQHIGDLETPAALGAFERVIGDFLRLYDAKPVAIAHDLHPDYLSTQWARAAAARMGTPLVGVQHHHAHLASLLAEQGVEGEVLGVSWDGTGWGPDGTVWGGEFLRGDAAGFERVAHLRTFALPGGDAAVRDPLRAAAGLLHEVFGPAWTGRDDLACVRAIPARDREVMARMIERGLRSPRTSSAGRLFDALAAIAGLGERTTFEGQAAMRLEFAADPGERGAYSVPVVSPRLAGAPLVVDWEPLLHEVLADVARGTVTAVISARVHGALCSAIAQVAGRTGATRAALSGGCFQNLRLTEGVAAALRAQGIEVLLHRQVPPNDGGISLGQAAVAAARLMKQ